MRARLFGESAVLVEAADRTPAELAQLLAGREGIAEVVPAARTLLVEYDPRLWTVDALLQRLREPADETAHRPAHVELPVRYDGVDLTAVAAATGRAVQEVIELHSAATYTVAFCGFSPGFAYLTGLHPALHVARQAEPRTSVPAGSVAIAGEFSAVYPRASPGGWQLLGTTDALLWDLERRPPTLLSPGTTVRFVVT